MRRLFLISTAVAALAMAATTGHAQQRSDQDRNSTKSMQRSNPAPRTEQSARPGANDRANMNERSTTASAPRNEQPQAAQDNRRSQQPSADNQTRDRAAQSNADRRNRDNASTQPTDRQSRAQRSEHRNRAAENADSRRNAQDRRTNERRNAQRNNRNEDRANGQATRSDRAAERTQSGRDSNRAARSEERSNRNAAAPSNRNATAERSNRNAASLSGSERTRVAERFSSHIDRMNVRPISRSQLRVNLRVGAVIPGSVRLYDVPSDVIALYPDFRRDRFVLVDDEIVVVESGSRHVVAVLPRGGGNGYAARETTRTRETTGAAPSSERLRLSDQERSEIRTVVMRDPACHHEARLDFTFGIPLPKTVKVCEFPETVVSEVPEVERYRFVVQGDDIVVVDPDEYRVVDVIR